ncbi:MAG: bifunctional methylenetetrahydrofolate dehydrogenase/methenyltetrahydrofolate cyclohydrolase FolD [Candidatus Woesearchaeota archaeon]|nr:bifunctional methylenetetrahydrofolate dehydrogenase/methenyltetrahydrofolate cyclohydrolase FolD [Candidatus Woesearchaeota archaeon]
MIIDGNAIAKEIRETIKKEVATMDVKPGLTVVLVGENPASKVYVNMKEVRCREAGFKSEKITLPASVPEEELLATVEKLNNDTSVHGILVQMPLPDHIDEQKIIAAIDPAKDVDGFHPVNVGKLLVGQQGFIPCTPKGVMHLLQDIDLTGKHAVVVGRSNIVGKPLALLLLQQHATVTVCHSRTKNLAEITQQAEVLIAAVGKAGLITADMVKEGAVVIDVGVNRVDDESEKGYHLEGDVTFAAVKEKASAITPVPGGVGPMTIAMLMQNTLEAAK